MKLVLKKPFWWKKKFGKHDAVVGATTILGDNNQQLVLYEDPNDDENYCKVSKILYPNPDDIVLQVIIDGEDKYLRYRLRGLHIDTFTILVNLNFIERLEINEDNELKIIYPNEFEWYFEVV